MARLSIPALVSLIAVCCNAASVNQLSMTNLLGLPNLIPDEGKKITYSSNSLVQLKSLLTHSDSLSAIYGKYKTMFHKEDRDKKQVFAENAIKIAEHNVKFYAGQVSWEMGVNRFTDMTEAERFLPPLRVENATDTLGQLPVLQANVGIPKSLDWRTGGCVTPVKNQGQCGSCVTFGTTAVVESAYCRKTGDANIDLSEQELLDCTPENNGCNGGWYTASFNQIKKNGQASEAVYPYIAMQQSCQRSLTQRTLKSSDEVSVGSCPAGGSATNLKNSAFQHGPVAVAISVSNEWFAYKSGIYTGSCASNINHAVAVVGYDTDHWIIKNSWGTGWGESGFMKLQSGNKCHVAEHCFYISM